MAAPLLIKHTAESRTYTFDFSGQAVPGGPRGTVWSQQLLADGEVFAQGLALPLLLLSLLGTVPVPTIAVSRSDGQPSDLGLGTAAVLGERVQLSIAGGTAGLTYAFTVAVSSNRGNVLVMQGRLLVVSTLP